MEVRSTLARVANTPCAGGCGKLLFVGRGSLPEPTCRQCRALRRAERAKPRKPRGQSGYSGSCPWCGGSWTAFGGRAKRQTYCSPKCRGLASRTVVSTPIHWTQCDQCDRWFAARLGAKRCSEQCRASASRTAQQQWADKRDNSERIMRLYRMAIQELDIPRASMWRRTLTDHLARRDGDRCGICNQWVDLDLPSGPRGNPDGPSIDHVVPVSQGGTDDLANLRLTHWACNNKRGNRGGNEQLRLIA